MEEQQKNIDEFFRESLGDFREEPPAAAWEAVRQRLDDDKGKRRRPFMWWPWVAVVLLLLVGGFWLVAEQSGSKGSATSDRVSENASGTLPERSPIAGKISEPVASGGESGTQQGNDSAVSKTGNPARNGLAKADTGNAPAVMPKQRPDQQAPKGSSPREGSATAPRSAAASATRSSSTNNQQAAASRRSQRGSARGARLSQQTRQEGNAVLGSPDQRSGKAVRARRADKGSVARSRAMVDNAQSVPPRASPQPQPRTDGAASQAQTTTPVSADSAKAVDTSVKPTPTAAIEAEADEPDDEDTLAAPTRKKQPRFSLAALAGYEPGMQDPAPDRVAGSVRALWNFNRSWSIGIQPAYRVGTVSTQSLTGSGAFQSPSPVLVDSTRSVDTFFFDTTYRYVVRQTTDSIVVPGTTASGRLWEVELPLILHYTVPRKTLHFYGGPTVVFGGKLGSTTTGIEQRFTSVRRDSIVRVNKPFPSDSFNNYFGQSSLPLYSTYDPAAGALVHPESLRFGYLLGLGYQWRRFLLDASIHQQLSGYKDVNAVLRKVYSSPYLRMSLGYQFFGPKPARRPRQTE